MLRSYNNITKDALRNTELPRRWTDDQQNQPWKTTTDEEVQTWKKYRRTAGRELHTGMLMGPQTTLMHSGTSTQGKSNQSKKYTGDGQIIGDSNTGNQEENRKRNQSTSGMSATR